MPEAMNAIDALGRLQQLAQTFLEERDASIFERHVVDVAAWSEGVVEAGYDLPRVIAGHSSLWAPRYARPATIAAAREASRPRRAPRTGRADGRSVAR